MYSDPSCQELGLQYGQVRKDAVLTNAGWFSHLGEKLGVGDISMKDLDQISRKIPSGEIFFALSEATCLSLPSHLDRLSPGIDFIIDNAVWAVNSADIFRLDNNILNQLLEIRDGVSYVKLSRIAARNNWVTNPVKPSLVVKVEKGAHWGLDVYHMQDNTAWAVGNYTECYDAASKAAYDLLWDTDPDIFARFIVLNSNDLASIKIMQQQAEQKCNNLISKLLAGQVNKCVDYMLQQDGLAYYLDLIDHLEHPSDSVPGLPTGLLAYRVDT